MLVGFIMLGEARRHLPVLRDRRARAAGALGGGTVTAALALILVGALTKSAQLPFHFWLPAAMAAPTPVSAYLHAAAMVKAGVYLVARLLARVRRRPRCGVPVVGARPRHHARRRLARAAAVRPQAAARLRHGEPARLPHGAGRRRHPRRGARRGRDAARARPLQGGALPRRRHRRPRHRHPRPARALGAGPSAAGSAIIAAAAAASMAGLPPLLGFVAKEAVFTAFLADDDRAAARRPRAGRGLGPHRRLQRPVPLGRVRAQARRRRHPRAPAGAAADLAGRALRARRARARHCEPRGRRRRAGSPPPIRGVPRRRRATTSRCGTASGCRCWRPPSRSRSATRCTADGAARAARRPLSAFALAQHGYELAVGGTERVATAVTGRLQVGLVPTYLTVILVTVVALPGTAVLVGGSWPDQSV